MAKKKQKEEIQIDAVDKKDKDPLSGLKRLVSAVKRKYVSTEDPKKQRLNVVASGKDLEELSVVRNYFGIWGIDSVLDGYSVNSMVYLWGNNDAGKTTTCISTCFEAQHTCRDCNREIGADCNCKKPQRKRVVFVHTENKVDLPYLRLRCVDTDAGDFIFISAGDGGETNLDIVRDMVESGEIDLVVIDSIDCLTPEKEISEEIGSSNVALLAKMLTKFLRDFETMRSRIFAKYKRYIALMIVAQKRTAIGGSFAYDKASGGNAKEFHASTTLRAKKPGENSNYVEYEMLVEKSKICSNGKYGKGKTLRFRMYTDDTDIYKYGDIDNPDKMIEDLREFGYLDGKIFKPEFIEEVKKMFPEFVELFDKKFGTLREIKLLIKDDRKFAHVIKKILLETT